MAFLAVGLQSFPQEVEPEWDDNACSELVNRLGKKLEKIAQMDEFQKAWVLSRAKQGGFLKWHELANSRESIILSNRNACQTALSFVVTFKKCGLPMSPVVPWESYSPDFIRALGYDLDEFRGLRKPQRDDVALGLIFAGFVGNFEVQESLQETISSRLDVRDADMTQLATSPPPSPPSDVISPNPSTGSPNIQLKVGSSSMPSGGDYPGSEIDKLLRPMQLNSLTSFPASNPMNGLHSDWTLFPSDGNLRRNMSSTAGMDDIGGPLVRSDTTSPETVSTPGLDGGPSCYSTPSTICVETPLMAEQLDFSGFGATSPTKPAETNSSDQTILCLLRSCKVPIRRARRAQCSSEPLESSCKVSIRRARRARCSSAPLESLNDQRIVRILEVDSLLVAQDPGKALRPLLDKWDINKSLDLPALGLPSRWKGIQAAVDYLRLLDAGPKKSGLDSIAERLGHVLLFLNYKELCKNPEKNSRLPGKTQTTSVLESILDCYTDDSRLSNPRQSRRNRITTYHLRRGKWWWRLAGNYGIGLFLTADSSLMEKMCNYTFIEPQIDVLVTLTLNTRPGSIRILNALESVVKSLVFANIRDDLRPVILDEKDGLLGKQNLAKAWAEDKRAFASQQIELPWALVNSKANAEQGMTGFSDS
ncbi:uncharacterized protein N7484_008155 [Penicillium longicatenatum]|uniref:uncharacterized protein n=1 Tax=Penicillium longicatenatum TaxID=1561947 RepID=UPI002548AAA6|nr:uncharacterized protein N7484_008155 [Penicillium longicatenatum]KAJ5640293.1 hypothetical protein N7484_008155 [Penicillium longicatenatum]